MVAYADTSFLVSLYGQDANSGPAQELAAASAVPFAFTPLLRHEARNAVRLALFRQEITGDECRAVIAAIDADVRAGVLMAIPCAWEEVYARGEAFSAAHTNELGTRASDLLHVASAVVLGVELFLTFDLRQKALAEKVGLVVRP
jgi:predicted nucleic acid-binding protein